MRLSRPLRRCSIAGSWKTIPISRRIASRSATTSRPRTRAEPEVGARRVARIEKSVVLPAPFGPRSANISPGDREVDAP
jgi:hypothetical protein